MDRPPALGHWEFWRVALLGGEPETTPGTPHAGYYLNRRRSSYPNPNPTVGGSRRKVVTFQEPTAIWFDDKGWHCVISAIDGDKHLTDVDAIDNVFSRCCRAPLSYADYLNERQRMETERDA